jgi:hypothetical protein
VLSVLPSGGAGSIILIVVIVLCVLAAAGVTSYRAEQQLKRSKELAALYGADDVVGKFADCFQGQGDEERNLVKPAFIEFNKVGLPWLTQRTHSPRHLCTLLTVACAMAVRQVGLTLNKAPPGTPPILQNVAGFRSHSARSLHRMSAIF